MLYDVPFLFCDDDLLAENTALDLALEGENQRILTTVQGYAGISPAPKVRTISATNVMPQTGMEKKFEKYFLESKEITMRVVFGGSGAQAESKGYLESVAIKGGGATPTELTFTFAGTPSAIE